MSKDEPGEDLEFDWPCDIGSEEMAEVLAWAELRGISADMLRKASYGGESESVTAANVFSYVDGEGRLVFVHDLGLEELLGLPEGASAEAIPAASTLPLSRARQIYGPDLAGFGRTYRLIGADVAGGTTPTRIDYAVDLFVKKAGKAR
jgi:hypothetical protein